MVNEALANLTEAIAGIQSEWPDDCDEHHTDHVAIGRAYLLANMIDDATDIIIMR
jgi:hypothetical protein